MRKNIQKSLGLGSWQNSESLSLTPIMSGYSAINAGVNGPLISYPAADFLVVIGNVPVDAKFHGLRLAEILGEPMNFSRKL